MGGGVFVTSLAFCVLSYSRWTGAAGGGWPAVAIDALLVTLFAAHHSLFAREPVKRWLLRMVPARLERSVYVWIASLLFIATCALWRPVGRELFHSAGWTAWAHPAVQLTGVWLIARAVRDLDPLELAGIRQVSAGVASAEPAGPAVTGQRLTTRGPYGLVRHPLYLGWILIVFGAAHMTGDRLTFAALTTSYLFVAIPWEEESLVRSLGEEYVRYRRTVRWRVIPFIY
jgi:protein-S-isoprenylcysteine O-methyltransferase Ste14